VALSDLAVRQTKATGTAYTLGDIDGLSLKVSAQGGKSWPSSYYWRNKQKRISLGVYPEISLREARLAHENTFEAVFEHWIERRKQEIKMGENSTHAKIVRVFEKDIMPYLGRPPIHEIKRLDLLEIVGRIK
jgi:hypothetical protein